MAIFKTYIVNPNDYVSGSFDTNFGVHIYNQVGSPPVFFNWLTNTFLGVLVGWNFTAPTTLGTFFADFTEFVGGELISWQIKIIVVAPGPAVEFCCTEGVNITWLNREGGFQNWVFDGVRTIKVRLNNDNTFKRIDSVGDLTKHYSEREEVYDAVIATTKDITRTQLKKLDSLLQAIQAYLFNEETQLFDIPILLDSKSYSKFKTTDKFFEVKITYIIATEIKIQSQ